MIAPSKKMAKPAANTTHRPPLPKDDPIKDDAPTSEADLAAKRSKLISELVIERKKVKGLNKDIMKKIYLGGRTSGKKE
jgi:hypothetical protein